MGTEAHAFGSWRLRGGRYEQHGLPVEVLSEFARYERLVIGVAKGIYKRRNFRQRAPRGFDSSFTLRLTDIQSGSVIPVLEIAPTEDDSLFEDGSFGIFEEARIIILEALRSIDNDDDIPANFPKSALPEFSRFGRSLQADEFIEFDANTPHAATYSQAIRRKIQERAQIDRFEVEAPVNGQITGVSAEKLTFDFRLARTEKTISGSFSSEELVADMRQYLDRSTLAPTVALSAVTVQSMDEEIIEIRDILGIEPLLPPEWSERLLELGSLPDGWLDGAGKAVTRKVIREAEALLLECLDREIRRPYIYPTEDGGVQFEWSTSNGEATAEVKPDGKVEIFAYSKRMDSEKEHTFAWRQLGCVSGCDQSAGFALVVALDPVDRGV
ncbi:hypothetical protein [Kitasatospora phosalacinea]|uniref:hypothetical protein n=1 Tax=Kitasatospora phosalacinea TaxID=2065 RepID=UPI0012FF2305|nr:hypothetical protein [Kitasatospora phosalacinea]